MRDFWTLAAIVGAAILAIGVVAFRRRQAARIEAERSRAIGEFGQRRNELAALCLEAAAATGKPRGLRWTGCELSGDPIFAVDDATGELIAMIAATISFAAVEGGGMEEVEAVGNLRTATAVFMHRGAGWITDGRAIFNLEPPEALAKFQATLRQLP